MLSADSLCYHLLNDDFIDRRRKCIGCSDTNITRCQHYMFFTPNDTELGHNTKKLLFLICLNLK